ncbi:hypothetical protein [Streptomyces sp. NRRL F-5053]|uniref:hypothetical protein n=1 Tax=Streptomyces sp. NRRL F-5053 TaxID=1463854 RepID=UPI001331B33A|nr:hypothetical protein [Streptomyces sp. NRRL F-5053]
MHTESHELAVWLLRVVREEERVDNGAPPRGEDWSYKLRITRQVLVGMLLADLRARAPSSRCFPTGRSEAAGGGTAAR